MTALLALGAALALAPVSTAVPGRVQDLAPRADGSVDVATVDPTTGAQLSRLAPDGALGSPLALAPAGNLLDYAGQVDQPQTQDLVEQVATLSTGGAVAVTWAGTHAAGGATTVTTSDAAGNVQPSQAVVLTFYDEQSAIGTPTAPTVTVSPADASGKIVFTVTWPSFACPAGSSVSGYNAKVTNGIFDANGGNQYTTDASTRSLTGQANSGVTPGMLITVSYTALCGDRESAAAEGDGTVPNPSTPSPAPTAP
ncbi:MAG: hypothetical protein AAGC46_20105 [Solirubrobacteraceae bacterium]